MEFGYARVSTKDQLLDRQLDQLQSYGIKSDNVYQEKITGTRKDRPELLKLMDHARTGDVIVVTDLTRISRSTKDLISLMDELNEKGINFKSLKETWMDTTTAQGKLMFTIMAGFSQFERDILSERTKEGLAAARARGHLGGRRDKLDITKKKAITELYNAKQTTVRDIASMFDVSVGTMYKAIKEINDLKQ